MTAREEREAVRQLQEAGEDTAAIAEQLGLPRGLVRYHLRCLKEHTGGRKGDRWTRHHEAVKRPWRQP